MFDSTHDYRCTAQTVSGYAALPQAELYALFQSAPNPYLIIRPDSPRFTIVDVNEQYLIATNTAREDLIGKPMFEAFPANPEGPGAKDLRASLERVLREQVQDEMGIQKYDIPRRKQGERGFEVKYWIPINTPVFSANGTISAIIHHVEDITEHVLARGQDALNLSEADAQILQAHTQLKEVNLRLK